MTPLLQNPDRTWKQGVFSRMFDARTLRTERYRLTRYEQAPVAGDSLHLPNTGRFELFDHASDPQENVNIAKRPENEALLRSLDEMLDAGWQAIQNQIM